MLELTSAVQPALERSYDINRTNPDFLSGETDSPGYSPAASNLQ